MITFSVLVISKFIWLYHLRIYVIVVTACRIVEFPLHGLYKLITVITAGEGDEEDEWFYQVAKLEHCCHTNSTQLKLLDEFTAEWHVAIGTKFFQLPSSYTFDFAEPIGCFYVKD